MKIADENQQALEQKVTKRSHCGRMSGNPAESAVGYATIFTKPLAGGDLVNGEMTVLVVDDDKEIVELMRDYLEDEQFGVVEA